jgi:hypothetical protein
VAAVFVVAGCARQDWIDRTLVTVDVTGTWSGYIKGTSTGGSREVTFELRQEGPKVTGVVNGIGFHGREPPGPLKVPLQETVSSSDGRTAPFAAR